MSKSKSILDKLLSLLWNFLQPIGDGLLAVVHTLDLVLDLDLLLFVVENLVILLLLGDCDGCLAAVVPLDLLVNTEEVDPDPCLGIRLGVVLLPLPDPPGPGLPPEDREADSTAACSLSMAL